MNGDRFLVVTEEDRRGTLWIVSIICCIYLFMVLGLRSSARQGSYGADDWLAVMATVCHYTWSLLRSVTDTLMTRSLAFCSPS